MRDNPAYLGIYPGIPNLTFRWRFISMVVVVAVMVVTVCEILRLRHLLKVLISQNEGYLMRGDKSTYLGLVVNSRKYFTHLDIF